MVVEIVGQSEEEKRRITCKDCGAVLSYYRSDIKSKTTCSYGETEIVRYIECPQCKTTLYPKDRLS